MHTEVLPPVSKVRGLQSWAECTTPDGAEELIDGSCLWIAPWVE